MYYSNTYGAVFMACCAQLQLHIFVEKIPCVLCLTSSLISKLSQTAYSFRLYFLFSLLGPVSRHVGRLVVSGLKPKTSELYDIAVWVVGRTATITNQIPLLFFLTSSPCLRRLCRAPGRARTPATPLPPFRPRSPHLVSKPSYLPTDPSRYHRQTHLRRHHRQTHLRRPHRQIHLRRRPHHPNHTNRWRPDLNPPP